MSLEGHRGYIHYFNGIIKFKPGASGEAVLFANELLRVLDRDYMNPDCFEKIKDTEVDQIFHTEIDLIFLKHHGDKEALKQHLLWSKSREKKFSLEIQNIINPVEIFEVFGFSAHALNNNFDHVHIFTTEVEPFVRQEQLFTLLEGYIEDCITVMNWGLYKDKTSHHETKIGLLEGNNYIEKDVPLIFPSRFTDVDSLKNRLSIENLKNFLTNKGHISELIPLNEDEIEIIKKIKKK